MSQFDNFQTYLRMSALHGDKTTAHHLAVTAEKER